MLVPHSAALHKIDGCETLLFSQLIQSKRVKTRDDTGQEEKAPKTHRVKERTNHLAHIISVLLRTT